MNPSPKNEERKKERMKERKKHKEINTKKERKKKRNKETKKVIHKIADEKEFTSPMCTRMKRSSQAQCVMPSQPLSVCLPFCLSVILFDYCLSVCLSVILFDCCLSFCQYM